ncbi:MAG: hypothetical protein LBM77_11215 [Spirochaetaceae bacterium]|jgi:hypothetical protein|nr:hypothetical protein [Spirochaetaceae bacterium]
MKNKKLFKRSMTAVMLIMVVTLVVVLSGCGSVPQASNSAIPAPELNQVNIIARTYMGPNQEPRDGDGKPPTDVYYIDPAHFEDLLNEIKAGGEYTQTDTWKYTRDWETGRTFARCGIRPDNSMEVELCNENNSTIGYRFINNDASGAAGSKLMESIRKFLAPQMQIWDNNEPVLVYFLNPAEFDACKAEMDNLSPYELDDTWNEIRNWMQGLEFARIAIRSDGRIELTYGKEENTTTNYRYANPVEGLVHGLGGNATVEGNTVLLSGNAELSRPLTVFADVTLVVPAGITLDLTAEGESLFLRNGATLTVNGTVNAKAESIKIESAAVSPASINGSGTINLTSKGHLLNIWSGDGIKRKLTLDGVTFVGLVDNSEVLVFVNEGSEFVMKSGAITGNTNTRSGGGGVSVWQGMFTMEGGEIRENNAEFGGGGVSMGGLSTFTMSGGAIWGNSSLSSADGGGGAFFGSTDCTFIMKGGVIYGNTSARVCGGVMFGGSSDRNNGTFIMEGGRIQGSTASDGYTANTDIWDSDEDALLTAGFPVSATAKWGTGGTYTKGGVLQTGGSGIIPPDRYGTVDTLIAIPAP